MVAMFTTQQSSPVKFTVNLKRRRIEVSFHHEFKAPKDPAYRRHFAEWQKMKRRAAREQEREEALLEKQAIEEGSKQEQEQPGQNKQEGSDQDKQEESDWEGLEESDWESQEESDQEQREWGGDRLYEEEDLSDTEYEPVEEWERPETYRFEIRFEHLGTLLEEPSGDINTRIFSISLPFPPEFYRKLHDTHRSFTDDPNARHWSERDSWFRQTVITYQQQCVDHLPITLRQSYAVIDIGMFTSFHQL